MVPSGLTRYREGLFPLEPVDREKARETIALVEEKQRECMERYGIHFVHASDEFYYLAGLAMPEAERYDGYLQLENGVGMARLLREETEEALELLKKEQRVDRTVKRKVTIATGVMVAETIRRLADSVMEVFPNIQVQVVPIRNHFFGESITVTGLITGQDLVGQLQEMGDALLVSSNMFRTGEKVFLDDMTQDMAEERLHVRLCPVDAPGADFVEAIINRDYAMGRVNDKFVYVRGCR